MSESYEAQERHLRRAAARQGLKLEKSRSRATEDPLWSTYQLADPATNQLVSWGSSNGFGLTLDQVQEALRD